MSAITAITAITAIASPLSIPSFQAVTPHYLMTRRANGRLLQFQE
jgi:hypothetical protein